jgi:hypothetical protein
MFKIRGWERYRFLIDYEHNQVIITDYYGSFLKKSRFDENFEQHKAILQRKLPDNLKLSIAKTIENNLFAKVC